jgi:hypothetical protein
VRSSQPRLTRNAPSITVTGSSQSKERPPHRRPFNREAAPPARLFSPLHSYNISMPERSDNQSEPLLIDRAAAAELRSAAAVCEWAREKRTFISSVMVDLAEERQAIAVAVRSVGLRAVLFEEFGGRRSGPLM